MHVRVAGVVGRRASPERLLNTIVRTRTQLLFGRAGAALAAGRKPQADHKPQAASTARRPQNFIIYVIFVAKLYNFTNVKLYNLATLCNLAAEICNVSRAVACRGHTNLKHVSFQSDVLL